MSESILRETARAFLREADEGRVSVETDRALRSALARPHSPYRRVLRELMEAALHIQDFWVVNFITAKIEAAEFDDTGRLIP